MNARTSKASTKTTATARAAKRAVNGADDIAIDAAVKPSAEVRYAFKAYTSSLGISEQDGSRPILSAKHALAGFLGSIAAMVLGYAVGMQIADWLALGVFWLTGWAYLGLAVWVISAVVTLIISLYTGGKVAMYIATGSYATDMEKAANWVTGKLSGSSTWLKTKLARDSGATVH